MNDRLSLPPLYAILDPEQVKERPASSILAALLKGGAGIVQLRAKNLTARDFLELALEVRRQTAAAGCRFIVNDRVDIALISDADGVHLGQEDLPLGTARKLMGEKAIGISTHDLSQAREAEKDGADYIGFGPIFGTATKETGYSARGIDMLREMRRAVAIPIVAIGGIQESNVESVWQAGADSAAMIGELMGAEDVEEKVRRVLRLYA
ncbi:MAG: thiamine phosphate synthase [Candidatus Binatia bacterium]